MAWPTVRPVRRGRTSGVDEAARLRLGLVSAGLLLGLWLGGCEPTDPARAGAEGFIDRYYVEIDLPAARAHASGLATVKLDREMELLEGVDAPEAGGKPQVNYRFLEERDGSDTATRGFLYELTIRFDGGGTVVRRSLVTVQQDGDAWRVSNFQEID